MNSLTSIKNLNLFISIYVENELISSLSSDSTIIKDSNSNMHVYEQGHEYKTQFIYIYIYMNVWECVCVYTHLYILGIQWC